MGFFKSADPTEKLSAQVAKNPNDAKLALDYAMALRGKGDRTSALAEYVRAAKLFHEQGFSQKGIAAAKQGLAVDPDCVELYESLAVVYEKMKVKEDLRMVLKKLQGLYQRANRSEDATRVGTQITALGPGR